MNIVIAGGQTKADFLISMFKKGKHNLVVINDDEDYADFLSKNIISMSLLPMLPQELFKQANIENFDIMVAVTPSDAANLAICQLSKKMLHIKKTVAAVNDPKNVDAFTKLGVDTTISATYLISKYIEKASILENMTRTIVSEYDSLAITSIIIQENSMMAGRTLSQIKLPNGISLGAIMRGNDVIVPNGQTTIYPNDKILIITPSNLQEKAIELINSKK